MNVKDIRKNLNLTQQQLAEKLGLGKRGKITVSEWETGKRNMSPYYKQRIESIVNPDLQIFCDVEKMAKEDFEKIVFHATGGEVIDAKEKNAKMSETAEYGKVIHVDVAPLCRVYICSDFQVFLVYSMRHPCENYGKILPILLKYRIQ